MVTAAEEKRDEKVVQKEVTGQVVWVGKRAISVEYDRTVDSSYEMLLPIDSKTLTLERLKSLAELRPGDTVRVHYNQTLKKAETGNEESVVNTVATKVALLRQAPVNSVSQSSELSSGQ